MKIALTPDPDDHTGPLSLERAAVILKQMSRGPLCLAGQRGSLVGLLTRAGLSDPERRALLKRICDAIRSTAVTERQAAWLLRLLTDPAGRDEGDWGLTEDGRLQVQRWMRELRTEQGQQALFRDPRPEDLQQATAGLLAPFSRENFGKE